MTLDEAYSVLGISRHSAFGDAEQAYKGRLKQLHLKLSVCTSPPDRQLTQDMIKQLIEAWQLIQGHAATSNPAPPAANPKRSTSQTPIPRPHSNTSKRSTNSNAPASTTRVSPQSVVIALAIAAILMFLVMSLCKCSYSDYKARSTATLRVISVPWCEVELDGEKLGDSGQPKAFEVVQGKHKLTFRKGDKTLMKDIRLYKNKLTVVKVQFSKGEVNVDQQ